MSALFVAPSSGAAGDALAVTANEQRRVRCQKCAQQAQRG
jgi:hypothetical protein